MIRQLSAAAATFGEGTGPLFDTVTELAVFTNTLAENDELVRAFMRDLAGVSSSLVSERVEIQKALSGRRGLGRHRQDLRPVQPQGAGHRHREADPVDEDDQLRAGQHRHRAGRRPGRDQQPGAGLQPPSGTIGSRIGIQGNIWDADGFLCAIVQQSDMPQVSKDLACTIFEQLLEPVTSNVPAPRSSAKQAALTERRLGAARPRPTRPARPTSPTRRRSATPASDDPTVAGLLGGGS